MGLRPHRPFSRSAALALAAVALGGAVTARSAGASTTSTPAPTSSTTTTLPVGPPKLVKGGTVVVAVPSLPSQFNPNAPDGATPVTAMVTAQVLPSPFVIGPNYSEQANAAFISAELVSVSPEVVQYTINAQARWSNGTPITAADFIEERRAQLQYGPQLPASDPYDGYKDIASITSSSDGKVVTVHFAKPYAQWEALFSGLVPAAVAKRYGFVAGFAGADPTHLLSGGPYLISKVVPGRELVLSRNPDWWGSAPVLDHIVFEVRRGQAALLSALQSGAVDVATFTPSRPVDETVWASTNLREQVSASPTLWQLAFNLDDPTISSLDLREAIAKATDRPELEADSVGFGAPNTPLSGNQLFALGAPNSQGNSGGYSAVDDTEATELLAAAGFDVGADGFARGLSGTPLVLRLVGPSGIAFVASLEAELRAQLLDVGIRLAVTNVPEAELLDRVLPRGEYQLALAPYDMSAYPAENARYYESPVAPVASTPFEATPSTTPLPTTSTTSTVVGATTSPAAAAVAESAVTFAQTAPGPGVEPDAAVASSVTADVLGYEDPAVAKLLSEAEGQLNVLSMDGLYNEADTRLWLDLPTLPLFQQPVETVSSKAILNLSSSPGPAGPLYDAQDWALEVLPPAGATGASSTTSSS